MRLSKGERVRVSPGAESLPTKNLWILRNHLDIYLEMQSSLWLGLERSLLFLESPVESIVQRVFLCVIKGELKDIIDNVVTICG